MYVRTFIGAMVLALLGTLAAQAQSANAIRVTEGPEFGAYLIDQNGMSLYLFEEDAATASEAGTSRRLRR